MATKKTKKSTPASRPASKSVKLMSKKPKSDPRPLQKNGLIVVGVGASAGGLEPLLEFFDALPPATGMAFVVVTHLHPEYESHMGELIQAKTKMNVHQLKTRIKIEPNHVYVIPPNRNLVVTDSFLEATQFEEPRGHRTPVDIFFRSLAKAHHGAVAVILSGGGTDGAVGVKDIKENGGLLLVQHPQEAEYESMPNAAIHTGLADLILPVRELAQKLVDYHQHVPDVPDSEEELSEEELDTLQRILAQVHARTGHDFGQYKRSTVLRRIQRRMQLNGFHTLDAYLAYLRTNASEASAMFNDILIGVTNFFRDRASWEALEKQIIPMLFADRSPGESIRVWSLGCATGEEAYSLAMLLLEHISKMENHYEVQVFASDLDDNSLMQARDGLYPSVIEADVSPERLERFFVQHGDHYQVKRELRDAVLFTNHSVLRDPPFSHVDLIACRNVLIYLQRPVQDTVFDIFHYALNEEGFLFLGNSESAEQAAHLFDTIDKRHRIYQARAWRGERPHLPQMPLTLHSKPRTDGRVAARPPVYHRPIQDAPVAEERHKQALEAYAPPSILVDENYVILHTSETAGRYLMQPRGPITAELLKLVRTELQLELRAALFQAFEKDHAVVSKPVAVQFNGHSRLVVISVLPRRPGREQARSSDRHALVVFLEDEIDHIEDVDLKQSVESSDQARSDAMVTQMQTEVQRLREQLQATLEEFESSNEEMKAANEELQSINEEYRSATEELETSKEELQSVNEELQTVNQELKSKLEEISRAHSDLENLMSSTEVAILFLDRKLRIHRYTPTSTTVFNIMPSDRGRPIAHLTNSLQYPNLVADAEQVLRKLVPIEREVKGQNNEWFLVRHRPYRTMDDKIDGVVITIIEITPLKKVEETQRRLNEEMEKGIRERTRELDEANRQLGHTRDMFYMLFHANLIPTLLVRREDARFINVNAAFLNTFGLKNEQVLNRLPSELKFTSSTIRPEQQAEFERQLRAGGSVRNMELQIRHPSTDELMTVLASFQQVDIDDTDAILVAFVDITKRVQAEEEIRDLTSNLSNAEQRERHRISQVLHDDLQQRLFAIKAQLTLIGSGAEQTDAGQLQEQLSEAIDITRNLSADISPAILHGEGLADALIWLAERMQERYGMEVEVNTNNHPARIAENLRVMLFGMVRELLFNIYKHSGQTKAVVTLEPHEDGWLRITVRDGGDGFDAEAFMKDPKKASGLLNMRHRLNLLGGRMEVISQPGDGSLVHLDVQVKPPEV